MQSVSYKNKRGESVPVTISAHAKRRFAERWASIFPREPLSDVEGVIARWFGNAQRVKNLSGQDRRRMERHGKDTLFFRTNAFTFVVQNGVLVTVEVSDRGERQLNRN
jgi:hypothetical protein